jgi:N utilization substance protein B
MSAPRDIRRCALQALYQFDAGNADEASVKRSLEEAPGTAETHEAGYELAVSAWKHRKEADGALAVYAEDWPTHRQPVVDRSLLRLAYYEMVFGETPPKVAINEAVELAKEFSTEKSSAFINGLLDKVFRSLREAKGESTGPWAVGSDVDSSLDADAQDPAPKSHE